MSHYVSLGKFPKPLSSATILKLCNNHQNYVGVIENPNEMISDELLLFLKDLSLVPNLALVFTSSKSEQSPGISPRSGKVWVHTDLLWSSDQWCKIPCGINWELTPSVTEFIWWDTKDAEECYPENELYGRKKTFQGIHYGNRNNIEFSDFEKLESVQLRMDAPCLVRTDIPHSVTYQSTSSLPRIGLSLRFPLEQIPTWERAVEIFRPVTIPN